MKNILALGTAASNIVESLNKYKVYNIFKIQNSVKKQKNVHVLPELEAAEEYENLDILHKIPFLKKIKNNVTLFVCGASKSSAFSLRLLEYFHKNSVSISVVYFQSDVEFSSSETVLQERIVRGVLQEYARSGVFRDIILVSNKQLEEFVENINVFEYFQQINDIFCSSYHMVEVFKNTKPLMSTFSKTKDSSRIKTIGVSNTNCEDRMFYPFNQQAEVVYYFGINEEKLKSQGALFRTLTENLKSKITKNIKVYFGIYPTSYEDDYVYVEYYSPKIQSYSLTNEE